MKLILLFVLVCNIVFGQQNLNQEIISLKDSVLFYRQSNPEKALTFGFEVLKIADFSEPTPVLVAIHSQIGEILYYQDLYSDAISFYNESLKLFEAIPFQARVEKKISYPPWILLNIGNVYFKNKNYVKAALKYNQAFENFKLFENTKLAYLLELVYRWQ